MTTKSAPGPQDHDQVCPICGGKGLIVYDVPVGDPDFGKAYPCPCQTERLLREKADELRRLSGLEGLTAKTFASFDCLRAGLSAKQHSSLKIAYESAQTFAREPKGWLLLTGDYGCGKTHLAAAIANEALARGEAALFVTVPDLLDHLRAAFRPGAGGYDARFEAVRAAPLLILDDLGTESPTPWALEKLYQIFNYRYNRRLPTVVTTNRAIEEIEGRVRSRLLDTDLTRQLPIDAPDYRSARASTSLALSSLGLHGDQTFAAWDARPGLPPKEATNLKRVYQIARAFARLPEGWLAFTGTHGCGKTHLAAAIANEQVEQGREVIFVTAPDLLDHLRATFNPGSAVSFDKLFYALRSTPLLALDDLGTESATPWAREKLFQLLDHRYAARLPTVFTFAKRLDEIEPKLASRLGDARLSQVAAIIAPSYRGQQKSKRRR